LISKILCIHPGVAYLPEIEAYKKYFIQYDIEFIDCVKDLNSSYVENDYDLLWYIMGTDFKKSDKPKVHDYASLSTGKYVYFKDKIKKYFNQKPDLRIFLNEEIKNKYNFKDDIPYLIRDMGVDEIFYKKYDAEKKYDFVYLGAITHERKIPNLFDKFKNDLKDYSLLVVGGVPDDIYSKYKDVLNIKFAGKVDYTEVPSIISQAKYAINMIPDIYPFNVQTSTKLLEYCALNLKVITTDYKWVNTFEKKHAAKFYKIDENFLNLNMEEIEKFNFIIPEVCDLKWNQLFYNLNLIQNIKRIL